MPSTAVIPANQTTYVISALPNNSVLAPPTLLVGFASNSVYRTLVAGPFPASSIPAGATITQATLDLYLIRNDQPAPLTDYTVYRATGPWSESTVTWNTQPPFDPTPVSTVSIGSEIGLFRSWDVTNLVAGWQAQTMPNYGVLLRSANEATVNLKGFSSRFATLPTLRPRFTVLYEPPAPPPVEIVATGDAFAGSQARPVGQYTTYTFWVRNTGAQPGVVRLEVGPDGTLFSVDSSETTLAPGGMLALVPYRFASFARVGYRSALTGLPTTLEIRLDVPGGA